MKRVALDITDAALRLNPLIAGLNAGQCSDRTHPDCELSTL